MAVKKKKVVEQEGKFFMNSYGGLHGEPALTPEGRASFVNIVEPNTEFDPPKYGLTMLFKKDDAEAVRQLKVIQEICREMAEQMYGDDIPDFSAQPIFRDGDKAKYDGYAGHWYIVAKNANKKFGKQPFRIIGDTPEEMFEAGVIVRGQVIPYLDKQGFSYKLTGLLFIKDDGVRFGGNGPSGTSLLEELAGATEAVKTNALESLASPEKAKAGSPPVAATGAKKKESSLSVL